MSDIYPFHIYSGKNVSELLFDPEVDEVVELREMVFFSKF